jgi:peptide subunit release factor RF-3
LRIFAVSGFSPPHSDRLSGVMTMATAVDKAVMVIDSAVLPLA